MAQGNDSSFSSEWETFFTEVARVVASANNQRGLANEEFSEYVVEQLEMIIISVSTLNSYLGSHLPSSELGSEIAISNMCEELSSLWNASDVYCPNGKSISTTHSVAGITRIVPLQEHRLDQEDQGLTSVSNS